MHVEDGAVGDAREFDKGISDRGYVAAVVFTGDMRTSGVGCLMWCSKQYKFVTQTDARA